MNGARVIAVLDILGGLGSFGLVYRVWQSIAYSTFGSVAGILFISAGACLLFGAINYNQMGVVVHLVLKLKLLAVVAYVITAILWINRIEEVIKCRSLFQGQLSLPL